VSIKCNGSRRDVSRKPIYSEQADIAALPTGDSLWGGASIGYRAGSGVRGDALGSRAPRAGPLPRRGGFVFVPCPRARFQTAAGRLERVAETRMVAFTGARVRREHVKSRPAVRHRVLCPASPSGRLGTMTPIGECWHRIRARPNLFVLLLREKGPKSACWPWTLANEN
jgi:hypothetical protein